jgi:hypothetical protein
MGLFSNRGALIALYAVFRQSAHAVEETIEVQEVQDVWQGRFRDAAQANLRVADVHSELSRFSATPIGSGMKSNLGGTAHAFYATTFAI